MTVPVLESEIEGWNYSLDLLSQGEGELGSEATFTIGQFVPTGYLALGR
jgi:hypothetical protein